MIDLKGVGSQRAAKRAERRIDIDCNPPAVITPVLVSSSPISGSFISNFEAPIVFDYLFVQTVIRQSHKRTLEMMRHQMVTIKPKLVSLRQACDMREIKVQN